MRKLVAVLSSFFATAALIVAPVAIPAAQAAVDPSVITGVTFTPTVVNSGEPEVLTYVGIPDSETTIWPGAWVYRYVLEGSGITTNIGCANNQGLTSPNNETQLNNYGENLHLIIELYASTTTCIDSATPPADDPLFSADLTILPNLSIPAVELTEGVAVPNDNVPYTVSTDLASPPWSAGGEVSLVSNEMCAHGLVPVSLPTASPLPLGVTFEATNSNEAGVVPGFKLVGTPESGTAGSYVACAQVNDGAFSYCSTNVVTLCAARPAPVAFAYVTVNVAPALAATGSPNTDVAVFTGAGAGLVTLLGFSLLMVIRARRRT